MSAYDDDLLQRPLPVSLDNVSDLVQDHVHNLARDGDPQLAEAMLQVAKDLFDTSLQLEQKSHPHIHPFVLSVLEPPAVSLRSSTLAKINASKDEDAEDPRTTLLQYTPLTELTVDGLDAEQVWAQLELRNTTIGEIVRKTVGMDEGSLEDEEDAEDEEEEEDEDDSMEDMSVDEWKRMMAEEGYEEGDSEDEDEDEDEEEEDDDDEEDSDEEEEEDEEDSVDVDGEEDLEDMEASDDVEGDLEDEDDEADDDEEEEDGDIDVEDEEEDDFADLEEDQIEEGDDDDELPLAGPSRKRLHPTLDDQFFSIDDFNRMTEEQEAGRVSSGRLGGDDEEDEDDLGDLGTMMLQAPQDDGGLMYSDFFDAPRRAGPTKGKSGKGKPEGKKGKAKGKAVVFEEEDLDDEEDEDEEEDEARGVFGRFKGDLFEDDEDEGEEAVLSTHERRQRELAKEIAELEQQAIGPKQWTLLGEASARARPENSLLEENLDFEHVAKMVPVITEERVQSIEELIKTRIRDNHFDSVVRVRAYEPTPFLPSRFFELQDTQSSKSLAQIYEDEFQSAAAGGKARDPRDEKLRKEHEEIDRLWGEICYKLDALSSLNFVPKQPKAQITTIDNLPTTSMETALPSTSAASTMLAPEELFAPPSASSLVARSELTPEQARQARGKARKARKAERQKLGDMAQLYGKKKSSKQEKEDALKALVKTGKGVTVVGKGDKEAGKRRYRDEDKEAQDGKRLKL